PEQCPQRPALLKSGAFAPPAVLTQIVMAGETIVLGKFRPRLGGSRFGAHLEQLQTCTSRDNLTRHPCFGFAAFLLVPFKPVLRHVGQECRQLKFQPRMARCNEVVVHIGFPSCANMAADALRGALLGTPKPSHSFFLKSLLLLGVVES